jgi:hypothetical protein
MQVMLVLMVVRVAVTGMRMIVSMRVCVRGSSVPGNATGKEYVRQSNRKRGLPVGYMLKSGRSNNKEATKVQSEVLVTSQGCRKRKIYKRRR